MVEEALGARGGRGVGSWRHVEEQALGRTQQQWAVGGVHQGGLAERRTLAGRRLGLCVRGFGGCEWECVFQGRVFSRCGWACVPGGRVETPLSPALLKPVSAPFPSFGFLLLAG